MNSKNYVGEQGQPLFKTISILCSGARFVPLLGSEVLQGYWGENGSYQGRRSLAENISRHWYGCQWERVVDLEWIQWHWKGMLSIKVKRFIEWKFHIRKMFGLMQRVTQWPGKPIGLPKNPKIKLEGNRHKEFYFIARKPNGRTDFLVDDTWRYEQCHQVTLVSMTCQY